MSCNIKIAEYVCEMYVIYVHRVSVVYFMNYKELMFHFQHRECSFIILMLCYINKVL